MTDILFCPPDEKGKPHSLTGLNTLLLFYIITYFIKRIIDIFSTYKTSSNQTKNKSLLICILKIVLEWAKALIIIICLREQGLPPQPSIIYTIITFIYYLCTESLFFNTFPKILQILNIEKLEGLEILYAPVFLNVTSLFLSLIFSTCLYMNNYIRLGTFIFYHSIILNYKYAKTKYWQELYNELEILSSFRHATLEEIIDWNDICAICLQTMKMARITNCCHLFHAECLRNCLKASNQCPLCKNNLITIIPSRNVS